MKLNIFYSTTKDGIMSNEKKYFPNLNQDEINLLYETNCKKFFQKLNIPLENVTYLDTSSSKKIKSRFVTNTLKNSKESILLLKSTTPNLLVAAKTTNMPLIVATANINEEEKISAIALGTIENLNNYLLHEMIEALIKETDKAPFEMTFYIGPCQASYELKDFVVKNTYWSKALSKKNKKTYLDLKFAIFNELINEIVDPNYIYFDTTDITDKSKFYQENQGAVFACCLYTEE